MRELRMLTSDPPPGVAAWPVDDSINHLEANVDGPSGSPFEGGVFKLDIQISDRCANFFFFLSRKKEKKKRIVFILFLSFYLFGLFHIFSFLLSPLFFFV